MVKPHPAPQAQLQNSSFFGTSTESQTSLSLIEEPLQQESLRSFVKYI